MGKSGAQQGRLPGCRRAGGWRRSRRAHGQGCPTCWPATTCRGCCAWTLAPRPAWGPTPRCAVILMQGFGCEFGHGHQHPGALLFKIPGFWLGAAALWVWRQPYAAGETLCLPSRLCIWVSDACCAGSCRTTAPVHPRRPAMGKAATAAPRPDARTTQAPLAVCTQLNQARLPELLRNSVHQVILETWGQAVWAIPPLASPRLQLLDLRGSTAHPCSCRVLQPPAAGTRRARRPGWRPT